MTLFEYKSNFSHNTFSRFLDPGAIHDIQNATSITVFQIRKQLRRQQKTPTGTSVINTLWYYPDKN